MTAKKENQEVVEKKPAKRGRPAKAKVVETVEETVVEVKTPAKRGRKPKAKVEEAVETVEVKAPVKRGRKPKAKVEEAVETVEVKVPAKRGRKPKAKVEETAEPKKVTKRTRKTTKKEEVKVEESVQEAVVEEVPVENINVETEEVVETPVVEEAAEVVEETPVEEVIDENVEPETPRRSIAFIGSECYPFVKSGGLGDVMYALPKALVKQNCDVKVIIPRYKCIPQQYQEKMHYVGSFDMDLCSDGKSYYVGIMEYEWDGVVYDFIDNEEFFSEGKPYTSIVNDIPKFCYFAKAALAALNYLNWIPDVIHCHDWQAALVPVMLRTLFADTPLSHSKSVMTIHNLRFQGVYNIETIQYWTNLPSYVFNKDALSQNWLDANMLKGGLTYCDAITTVSNTYADEIQTEFFGEKLDDHLRYHAGKLRGIVNGIDIEQWNPATDPKLAYNYDINNCLEMKKANKKALQEELGLEQDDHKIVIGLISRLTDQKGLDLVNEVFTEMMDEHTQIVILGTGDKKYEEAFRTYESWYKGNVASCIQYDEGRAHRINAAADLILVPSLFEPCGLTQLNAMRYGGVPVVRETGGLKDTVEPYNVYENTGNGFTFDRYESALLLDAINRAKTLFFTNRWCFDEMVQRNMAKDVSWAKSAKQYKDMYLELTQW